MPVRGVAPQASGTPPPLSKNHNAAPFFGLDLPNEVVAQERRSVWREYATAATITLPSAVCVCCAMRSGCFAGSTTVQRRQSVFIMGTLAHMHVSVAYHLWCARNSPAHPAGILLRRLDHAFIYIIGICYAYALSGDLQYTMGNAAFSILCILRLWAPSSHPCERRATLTLSVLGYCSGLFLYAGKPRYFRLVLSIFAVSATSFTLSRWGHVTFHIGMVLYVYWLLDAIVSETDFDSGSLISTAVDR